MNTLSPTQQPFQIPRRPVNGAAVLPTVPEQAEVDVADVALDPPMRVLSPRPVSPAPVEPGQLEAAAPQPRASRSKYRPQAVSLIGFGIGSVILIAGAGALGSKGNVGGTVAVCLVGVGVAAGAYALDVWLFRPTL